MVGPQKISPRLAVLLVGSSLARSLPECLPDTDPRGFNYIGMVSRTRSGLLCERWDFPDPDMTTLPNITDHNYCRNPDKDPTGPWCYLARSNFGPGSPEKNNENDFNWEHCHVAPCSEEIKTFKPRPIQVSEQQLAQTVPDSIKKDQKETHRSPIYSQPKGSEIFARKILDNSNRNPEEIDYSEECLKIGSRGYGYRGTHSTTVNGYTCQKWTAHIINIDDDRDSASTRDDGWKGRRSGWRSNTRYQARPQPTWPRSTFVHEPSKTMQIILRNLKYEPDHNYCRNYDFDSKPWCYTNNPLKKWEYCDIAYCDIEGA